MCFGNGAAKLGTAIDHLAGDPRVTIFGIGPLVYKAPQHLMPPIQIGDLQMQNLHAAVIAQTMRGSDILLRLDFFRHVHVWISHSSGQLIMQFPPAKSPLGEGAMTPPPGPAP